MEMQKYGSYAFLLGVLIAIIASLVTLDAFTVSVVLIVLGLIVGFLNITDKETTQFLVAAVALILTGTALAGLPAELLVITRIVLHIGTFVAPAALIVALKAIWNMASSA